MQRIPIIFCLIGVAMGLSIKSHSSDIVYRGLGEFRDAYHTELLQAIFDRAAPNTYTAKSYSRFISHRRGFQMMENGTNVDIMIGYATQERVEKYTAVNIPVMKGLSGWRVAMIHEDNPDLLKRVNNIEQLKAFLPGMFHSWSDHQIFSENGLPTLKAQDFIGAYKMLGLKRFDYLPLSILEAESEARAYKKEHEIKITTDSNILIAYPVCFYFYVSKENKELARILKIGFEKVIADGSLNAIFDKHFKAIFNKYLSDGRTIIHLDNPLLPKSVPLERPELWLHVSDIKGQNIETDLY